MNAVDPAVHNLLERHYPRNLSKLGRDEVLGLTTEHPHHRWRVVALAAALLVSTFVPTHASASVRDLVGFPQPVLDKARLMVSTPVGDGRIVRVWTSPSDTGGVCWFSTTDTADTDKRPVRMGGGGCSVGGDFRTFHSGVPMTAGLGVQAHTPHWVPPVLSGWISPTLHATRVELRSRTGFALKLALNNGYFVGVSAKLFRPSFENLPYYVIAYDSGGHEVARQKIASASFYLMQKKDLYPRLRAYVRAHPGRHIMSALATSAEPSAFARAERAGDKSASRYASRFLLADPGDAIQVRRVVRYADGRGRSTELFVAKSRKRVCIILVKGEGAGAGCSPLSVGLFPKGAKLAIISGKYIAGIGTDDVRRVVLTGTRGRKHLARLTADNAFIYDCKAWNGCPGLVATINAYDAHGKLIDQVAGP